MVGVITAVTILSYMLWTIEENNIQKYGIELLATFPFVLYGMFRYLYLVHKRNQGGDPTELIYKDYPLLINLILWLIAIIFIMFRTIIIAKVGHYFF
jgi:ABC-type phosphate transport system permease subunit